MKKIVNLKEIFIVLIALVLITFSTTVLATDVGGLVIGENTNTDNGVTTITDNEYQNAQNIVEDENNTTNETENNVTNNSVNNATDNNVKKYNTVDEEDEIPQTGIEDYNIGILLIICVASAIFAYKKINDYKNI